MDQSKDSMGKTTIFLQKKLTLKDHETIQDLAHPIQRLKNPLLPRIKLNPEEIKETYTVTNPTTIQIQA